MELSATIKKLESIYTELNKSSNYLINEEAKKLQLIILDFKTELLNSSTTGSTAKNRNKKLLSWHKKMLKTIRPTLAYSTIYKDYQVITDSYFMAGLKDDDQTPVIPDYTTTKYTYPHVNQIINNMIQQLNDLDNLNIDIVKINNILKLNDIAFIKKDNKIIHTINQDAFKNLMLFLNINNNDDIKKVVYKNDLLTFETINGSIGVINSIRLHDDILKKATAENTIEL